ncbi:MAG: DNA polymerase IV [Candidatus Palauibacterales bacterium]|nr:DNA polymerase IV [Candidatus Palauibacterales bacterium]MDP2583506.1 DNA polymerase IV [Candidatus Palauibacterales bacterium]
MSRTVLHVDMDAFFASVEQREDPSLRGRPVVVGSDPQGGRGRGVVAAASYEARRYGIHSAQPISEAWRRCPNAVYLRPRRHLYSEVSAAVFEIFGRYTDLVEPLSIDEAFLDVTGSRQLFGPGPEIARRIKREVRAAEDLTASVGVAASKFVAKIASDLDKPDGLVVVSPGEERAFLASLEIRRLWGAGPRALDRFRTLGVATFRDAAELPLDVLVESFGEARGRRFHELVRGLDDRPVRPDRERKSLGKEITFDHDLSDRDRVRRTLFGLCEETALALRARGLAGSTVTVKLRWEGFETVTRQASLDRAVNTTERIWPVARDLMARADRPSRRVRLVGVSLSSLVPEAGRQLSLFTVEGERRDERVAAVVDRLAERFGPGAVTRAALLEAGGRAAGAPADTGTVESGNVDPQEEDPS